MSGRGAGEFKDYSEVRSEAQIDIWKASIPGLVFKATEIEGIIWNRT